MRPNSTPQAESRDSESKNLDARVRGAQAEAFFVATISPITVQGGLLVDHA